MSEFHSDAVRTYLVQNVDAYLETMFDEIAGDLIHDIEILSERNEKLRVQGLIRLGVDVV